MEKKQRITRRSIFASMLSLAVCVSMLVGTSYAWFTDSASSTGNVIKSGQLNIELAIKTKTDNDFVTVTDNNQKKAFDYELWEPGYTEWVDTKVYTTGNLALKYIMKIEATGNVSTLADVIDVYYATSDDAIVKPGTRGYGTLQKLGSLKDAIDGKVTLDGTLIPGAQDANGVTAAKYATIALHMQESAGNEYQNLDLGSQFNIQVLATQLTHERDSFDDQYDKGAFIGATTLSAGSNSYSVTPEFAASVTGAIGNDGKIPNNKSFTADINNPADLAAFSQMISDGVISSWSPEVSRYINIEDDLDMSGVDFEPIDGMVFRLNGNGHTISNLNDSLFKYAGNVVVENLVLENVNVSSATAGIIAGNGEGLTLKNVEIKGTNSVTYDPDGWHVHNNDHKGAGVLTALDAGVTIQENVKITGDVTVNYNNVEFKFGNNYDIAPAQVSEMFGAIYAGTPSSSTGITVTGTVTTNGSYTTYRKPVTMNIGGTTYEVSPDFQASMSGPLSDGSVSGAEQCTATIATAGDLIAFSKMVNNGTIQAPWGDGHYMKTLNLTADIDLAGTDWTTFSGSSITINGNNHKISNLNSPLMQSCGYTFINDLTLENVTASGDQTGAFVGHAEGLELRNCTLAGTVNISYEHKTAEDYRAVGAFIGWQVQDAIFDNVSIAPNAVISVVTTGIENGHADSSLLSHNAYVGKGNVPSINVGAGATVTLTE